MLYQINLVRYSEISVSWHYIKLKCFSRRFFFKVSRFNRAQTNFIISCNCRVLSDNNEMTGVYIYIFQTFILIEDETSTAFLRRVYSLKIFHAKGRLEYV